MSNGFIYLYEHGWSNERAAARIAALRGSTITLENPANGRITKLSDDLDTLGDQIDISADEAVAELTLTDIDELSIQFWFDKDSDVCVAVHSLGEDRIVSRFSLDGVHGEHRDSLIALVVAESAADTTDALVIDHYGMSDIVDWDELVYGHATEMTRTPDLVALDHEVARRYPLPAPYESSKLGHLVVFDRAGLLHGRAVSGLQHVDPAAREHRYPTCQS